VNGYLFSKGSGRPFKNKQVLAVARDGVTRKGHVKIWSDQKGFGFITPDDGGDHIFVHHSQIQTEGFRTLKEGQCVEYERVQDRCGIIAERVRAVGSYKQTPAFPVARDGVIRKGHVKWWSDQKGFGFITPEDGGKDLFVHHRVIQVEGFRTLKEGQSVEYERVQESSGIRAERVRVVGS